MNSFYSIVYNRFSELQISQLDSTRFAFPAEGGTPFLRTGELLSDCVVGIPEIKLVRKTISYGPFSFEDNDFGQISAVKLIMASISLLASKAIFRWLYRKEIKAWVSEKPKSLRARYAANIFLDLLARQRIRATQGDAFYNDVIATADCLSSVLMDRTLPDFPHLSQNAFASLVLGVPVRLPNAVMELAAKFEVCLTNLSSITPSLARSLPERLMRDISTKMDSKITKWEEIARQCEAMYDVAARIPGKWHNLYLPYSNLLDRKAGDSISIFQGGLVSEADFRQASSAWRGLKTGDDSVWQDIYFEFIREIKFREKIMDSMVKATRDLNFSDVLFPACDYVSFSKMHAELSPDIRRITDRVRMVKNSFDENTFQETGSVDLQLAIQSIASQSRRTDIFNRDEELMKEETWSILVDSSKSLGGSEGELRAISICLAETAHGILGTSPWGMFAFSDELFCIKHYAERYDNLIKARIGGLKMSGLSHIPDAIRACANLARPHSKDHNFMILISDGLPSGYPGIEAEFSASVKELRSRGIDLIGMGIGSQSIKKTIRNARIVERPTDIAKQFMDVYMSLSS